MNDYIKKQNADINLKIAEAQKLLEDPSVAKLAKEEIENLEKQKADLEKTVNREPTTVNHDSSAVIFEIRSAAGGDEAGLFAADLLRMYQKFALQNNWRFEELDRNEGGLGNIKTVVVKITGRDVFEKLK